MTKAKRQTIALGTVAIDVFQLPDGSYCMSQTQVAETVGKDEISFRRFSATKTLKSLPGIPSNSDGFEEIEREGERGAAIRGVPLLVASAYWLKEASAKNSQAQALAWACMTETLDRRADAAFGVTRSEAEYQAATAEMMKLLGRVARERDVLLESYEIDDDARAIVGDLERMLDGYRREIERLRDKIREIGGDPDE